MRPFPRSLKRGIDLGRGENKWSLGGNSEPIFSSPAIFPQLPFSSRVRKSGIFSHLFVGNLDPARFPDFREPLKGRAKNLAETKRDFFFTRKRSVWTAEGKLHSWNMSPKGVSWVEGGKEKTWIRSLWTVSRFWRFHQQFSLETEAKCEPGFRVMDAEIFASIGPIMDREKKENEGKIRNLSFSFFNPSSIAEQTIHLWQAKGPWDPENHSIFSTWTKVQKRWFSEGHSASLDGPLKILQFRMEIWIWSELG